MNYRLVILFCFLFLLTSCAPASEIPTSSKPASEEPELVSPTRVAIENDDLSLVIQDGNDGPVYLLETKESFQMEDNRIGVWYNRIDDLGGTQLVIENGFTRLRLGCPCDASYWGEAITEENLLPEVDEVIDEYEANDVKVVMVMSTGSGEPDPVNTFQQLRIDRLLTYTEFMVTHFGDRVEYFEVWNEFGNTPKVDEYTNLVAQSYDLIKTINPDVGVIMGSVPGDSNQGYTGYGEEYRHVMSMDYMHALIDSLDFYQTPVEGLSFHSIYEMIPMDPYYQNYPRMIREIQEHAESEGFTGEYFADEVLWTVYDENDPRNMPLKSKEIAAKYYLRAITENRGLDVIITINVFFQIPEMDEIQNLLAIMEGAKPTTRPAYIDPSKNIGLLRDYSFRLPGGDTMVAVWFNGNAVEDSEGIPSTITIPGVSPDSLTGLDPYRGFEQELDFEIVDGDVVINDFLLQDYPVFIRFSDS